MRRAETREDARLAGVVDRWSGRLRRTWMRYTYASTAQLAVLLCLRAAVIGGSLLLSASACASSSKESCSSWIRFCFNQV